MTDFSISGRAAIVGLGATEFSKNSGRTEVRLAIEATLQALNDAGIDPFLRTASTKCRSMKLLGC